MLLHNDVLGSGLVVAGLAGLAIGVLSLAIGILRLRLGRIAAVLRGVLLLIYVAAACGLAGFLRLLFALVAGAAALGGVLLGGSPGSALGRGFAVAAHLADHLLGGVFRGLALVLALVVALRGFLFPGRGVGGAGGGACASVGGKFLEGGDEGRAGVGVDVGDLWFDLLAFAVADSRDGAFGFAVVVVPLPLSVLPLCRFSPADIGSFLCCFGHFQFGAASLARSPRHCSGLWFFGLVLIKNF